MPNFKVKLLEEAAEFIAQQSGAVRRKIFFNIDKVSGGIIDINLFKKLTDSGIWEFRTKYDGQEYRLLAFWDTDAKSLVMATHGFSKKTRKTPPREIAHAEQIMKEYLKQK